MISLSAWTSEFVLGAASVGAFSPGRRRRRRRLPRRWDDGPSPVASPAGSALTAESSPIADGMKSGVSLSLDRASLKSNVVPSLPSGGAVLSELGPPPRRRRRRGRRDRCSDSSSGSTSDAETIRSDSPATSAAGRPEVSTTLSIAAGRTSELSLSSGQTNSSPTDCPVARFESRNTASAACVLCATASSRGGRAAGVDGFRTEDVRGGGDCSSKIPEPKSSETFVGAGD